MTYKVHLLLFLSFIAILGLNSGIDNENKGNDKNHSLNRPTNKHDSIQFINKLVGEWKWDSTCVPQKKIVCYAGYFYKIAFYNNSELKVYKNEELVQVSRWKVNHRGNSSILTTSPFVESVSGEINFKNNQLIFVNKNGLSYNYFFSKNL